jgi:signal transduction histidine kinase
LSQEYLGKGLVISEKEKNKVQTAFIYNRFAAVYHELSYRRSDSNYSYKAIEFADKSLDIYKQFSDTENIINNYNIIGAAYNFQGLYEESLRYLFLALGYADKDNTYKDKGNILNNIASVYNFKKEYDKAIKYALISNKTSKELGINAYIIGSARELATSYLKKGDFENAFRYLEESSNLYVTLFDERKTAEIYGLQKKHESDLIQQEENAKTIRLKIIGLSVISIILIVSSGIYIRHRKGIIINKELSKRNKLILEQKEELSRLNSAKDKFISILSHDIRNPLNGILGFSDILDSDYDKISEKEKREYIGYLKASSESLYKLIDRILMWSRLQRGNLKIKKEKLNLCEVVSVAVGLQKANAIRKGIVLENNIEGNIFLETDKNLLDTVIRNLVDNAVKFTNAGGKVNVYSEIKENVIAINVADTGVGIEKEHLDKLFEIENTVSQKGTAEEEGTGLGLTLCKDMLVLIGTNLQVESEKEKGSRFFFELPLVKD